MTGALKMQITSWGVVALDKRELNKVMRAAGNDIKSKTRRVLSQTSGSGRLYRGGGGAKYRGVYKAGHYRASAPGEPPVTVTGTLRNSLTVRTFKDGAGFSVREKAYYALPLEAGAQGGGKTKGRAQARRHRRRSAPTGRVLQPRPSLDKVMAQEAGELNRRLGAAFAQGLTWRQTR